MKTGFVILGEKRIRLSAIKKYEPVKSNGESFGIRCYYSLSVRRDHDVFYFEEIGERDEKLDILDSAFEI